MCKKNMEFEKKDITFSNLLRNMTDTIYEYNNDVEILVSEKYIKRVLKGIRKVSIHKNKEETTIVLVTHNIPADTYYSMILVGDNKTKLYKFELTETNDKQYMAINRSLDKKFKNQVVFSETKELAKTKRK